MGGKVGAGRLRHDVFVEDKSAVAPYRERRDERSGEQDGFCVDRINITA